MAGGRLIGEAYIALLPDASLFRTKAASEVDAALAGLRGNVKLTADAGDVTSKITAIAAALKGLNKTANIDLGTKGALVDISTLGAALEALKERAGNIPLDVNNSTGLAKVFALIAGIEELQEKAGNIDADMNINRVIAKYYTLEAGIKSVEEAAQSMRADFNTAEATAQLTELSAGVAKLSSTLADMRAGVNDAAALAKIVSMQAAALKLAHTLANMPATADTLPFQADMFKLAAQVEALKRSLDNIPVKVDLGTAANLGKIATPLSRSATLGYIAGPGTTPEALNALNLAVPTLNTNLIGVSITGQLAAAALAKINTSQSMLVSSNAGGWWGAWTTKIRLFGGALDSLLPHFLTQVSVWHLGADMILELAAAWGPAIIAVSAFAAVAAPIGEKIYGQWSNINTILDGVGGKLPDLGTGFDTLQRAVEPSVLTAFGEAMMVLNRNAAPLGAAIAKVGAVIDAWGASLVSWAGSADKTFTNVISVGAKDFAQLGYAFEQVFRIIGDLIKDLPGYVHILLTLGDAFLTVVADIVSWASPLLKVGLAVHGFILYVGLAVTAVVALGRAITAGALASYAEKMGTAVATAGEDAAASGGKFNAFGTAIGSFAGILAAGVTKTVNYGKGLAGIANESGIAKAGSKLLGDAIGLVPFGVAGLAAAGLAAVIGVGLYFAFRNSTDAAQKFNAQVQEMITSSNFANIGQNLSKGIAESVTQLDNFNAAYGRLVNNANARGGGVWATSEQQKYLSGLTQAESETATYGNRMSQLTGIFGSVGAAQSAATLLNISAGQIATETNKTFATQLTELEALAKGYGYMGSQAGAAGAQLNALNISTGDTYKNIQSLVSAEQAWITLITGGDSAFTAYEQGFSALNTAVGKSAASAPTVTVTLGKLRQTFTALGGTMSGTSAASLAVRQAFDSQLTAGVTLFGNLQMLAGASGNTASAQAELAKAGKDIIAQMLPFAAGSKEATAEVSALAQLMGGPATDNFQTLAKWVGNTKGAESDLNTEQAKLTISSANLTTAAKNLGNALLTEVTNMEANKVATATLSGAVSGLFTSFQQGHGAVTSLTVSMAGEYMAAMKNAGVSTQQAQQYLNAYLKTLGYSPSAIAAIDTQLGDSAKQWETYDSAVKQNAAAAKVFQADTMHNSNALAALNGLIPLTSSQFNSLWGAIVKQDQAMAQSGKDATGAKAEFIDFAENGLKLTASQAQTLWAKFGQQNLDTMGTKAGSTKSQFIQLAENGLHLTTTQAQTLWSEFALQNLDSMASKGNSMKNQFILLARNGLDLTASAAQNLWTTLTHQYLDTLASKAGETRAAFILTAGQFGITRQAAIDLWNSLKQIPANVHTNVSETLSGSGVIKAAITAQSLTLSSAGAATQAANLVGVGKAAGGKISGWDNHDRQLAVLEGGETVVPKNLSTHPAFTSFAKNYGIPGFATGGVVGVTGSAASALSNVPQGISTAENAIGTFTNDAMTAWIGKLNPAYAAATMASGTLSGGAPVTSAVLVQLIKEALNADKAPASWLPAIELMISKESGGNPSAIDPIVVDGQHATGLMQMLPSTFSMYGGTGSIMNPLANLEAAIRYIIADYGSPFNIVGIGRAGVYKGYSKGGPVRPHSGGGTINEPVYGYGLNSGLPYSFAENGQPEFVSNAGQAVAAGNGGMQAAPNIGQQTIITQNNMMIKLLQQLPYAFANGLATGAGNGVKHGYYGAQG